MCLTGYLVFLLMLSGVGEMTVASLRAEYTVAGGALSLIVYVAWPSWAGDSLRGALAEVLDSHRAYVDALLNVFESGQAPANDRLGQLRSAARLARSNAEATIERMAHEPACAATLEPQVAMDVLAALRRNALAALALHAEVERAVGSEQPGVAPLRSVVRPAPCQPGVGGAHRHAAAGHARIAPRATGPAGLGGRAAGAGAHRHHGRCDQQYRRAVALTRVGRRAS